MSAMLPAINLKYIILCKPIACALSKTTKTNINVEAYIMVMVAST